MAAGLCVEGTLTETDLMPGAQYAAWHRARTAKLMAALACLFIVAGAASMLMGEIVNGIVPLLAGGFYCGYIFLTPKLQVVRHFKAVPHLSEPGHYEFDEERFSLAKPSLTVSMTWTEIHSVVELNESFAIFTAKLSFLPVPKRFFTADQVDEFRALLQRLKGRNGKPLYSKAKG